MWERRRTCRRVCHFDTPAGLERITPNLKVRPEVGTHTLAHFMFADGTRVTCVCVRVCASSVSHLFCRRVSAPTDLVQNRVTIFRPVSTGGIFTCLKTGHCHVLHVEEVGCDTPWAPLSPSTLLSCCWFLASCKATPPSSGPRLLRTYLLYVLLLSVRCEEAGVDLPRNETCEQTAGRRRERASCGLNQENVTGGGRGGVGGLFRCELGCQMG